MELILDPNPVSLLKLCGKHWQRQAIHIPEFAQRCQVNAKTISSARHFCLILLSFHIYCKKGGKHDSVLRAR